MDISKDMHTILDTALGCTGRLSLDHEIFAGQAERLYERCYARLEGLERSQDLQAKAYRLGLHNTMYGLLHPNSRFSEMDDSTFTVPKRPDNQWHATVDALARLNIEVAKAFMPESLQISAEIFKSHGEKGNVEMQCQMLEIVFKALTSTRDEEESEREINEDEPAWMEDFFNQPLGRIFPRLFLKDEGLMPNCLGKAEVLAAFCELAEAEYWGFTPLVYSSDVVAKALSNVGQFIRYSAAEIDIELPKRLEESLAAREEIYEDNDRAPTRFHMGLLIKLCNGGWYMIDPHQRTAHQVEDTQKLSDSIEQLSAFCVVQPGIALPWNESEDVQIGTQLAAYGRAGEMLKMAHDLANTWDTVDRTSLAVTSLLSSPGITEALIERGEIIHPEEREKLLKSLGGEGYIVPRFKGKNPGDEPRVINLQTPTGKKIPFDRLNRMHIALVVITQLCQKCPYFEPEEEQEALFKKAMDNVLKILHGLAFRDSAAYLGQKPDGTGHFHPMIEIYEPSYRIGIELLSHVNAVTLRSDEVVMELTAVCGGQHHLTLAAAEPYRILNPEMTDLAKGAARVLEVSPVRLHEGNQVLDALIEDKLIAPDLQNRWPEAQAPTSIEELAAVAQRYQANHLTHQKEANNG